MRATQRFSKIDKDKTAANAEAVLLEYPHRKALASRSLVGLQSPKMDGMPRSPSAENHTEDPIINHLDDKLYVYQCEKIVNEILPDTASNDKWPTILKLRYLIRYPLSDADIMERVHYEHTAYYDGLKEALCAFAELWPPFPSELVVRQ
ncbi:MAG: ArpU family phage packaging/lysis transcriptional regulator [Schleiferilactobacillus perolens]|uniref:ArpU family phage packaging/lysis transcriptional regulator n=1 Tax=Schleiferilactobacillus perolens TaxID=100468 RepID=UPI0039EA2688